MTGYERKQMMGYFKEPELFLVFALLHTDGKVRNDFLELLEIHCRDKALATAWRAGIVDRLKRVQHLVEPEFFQLAHAKLNQIFDLIVYTPPDEEVL